MNTVVFMNEPDVAKATAQSEPGFDFRKEFGPVFSGWEQDVQTLVKVRALITVKIVAISLELVRRIWRIL